MDSINIKELVLSNYCEPTFYVNYSKIGRPTADSDSTKNIQKNNNLIRWKIENDKLIQNKKNHNGIFFSGESYIVQWFFDLKIDNTILEECLVFYWKGQHALKGYTPLPPELEEHFPVERIVQWSEPAIFFHGFPINIVFSGNETEFDLDLPHLLLARGEIQNEIHFYEVPCKKASLRSKASYLLIVPRNSCFIYWHGAQISSEYRKNIVNECQPHSFLKKWQNSWSGFVISEQEENKETDLFLDTVLGDSSDFIHVHSPANFSPRLFYLNSITGCFLATEVEYPLRAKNVTSSFPFLQSHLYKATQPALFLLDNNKELWLWEGIKTGSCDNKAFEEELKLANKLHKKFAEEKEKLMGEPVTCFHIYAHEEPVEFKNIFPFWVDD